MFEPRALDELIPDWRERGAPLDDPGDRGPVSAADPSAARCACRPRRRCSNHGNYIISLGNLCRWLAQQAEALGVEIYPGFAAAEVLYDEDGRVRGVATGDMGIGKDGKPTDALSARHRAARQGDAVRRGLPRLADQDGWSNGSVCATATIRRPMRSASRNCGRSRRNSTSRGSSSTPSAGRSTRRTYGGSFLYHLEGGQVAVGFVIGLDYRNPCLTPFEELQRFKTHPAIRPFFEGGRRIAYGARALNEGGLQSIPRLDFPAAR